MKRIAFLLPIVFFSSCDLIVGGIQSVKEKVEGRKQKEDTKTQALSVPAIKDGVKKYYFDTGELKSVVTYENNQKVGVSTTFYKSGEKQYEIPYVDGLKQGIVKWYYKSGQVYRETEYYKGKKSGYQRKYWENKKLKSEVLYFDNLLCKGLKEYTKLGKEKKEAHIMVERVNQLKIQNKYILKFRLSNGRTKVKFFAGKLIDGKYFPKNGGDEFSELLTAAGVGVLELNVSKGYRIDNTINVVAVESTVYQNTRLLTKSVSVSAEN